MSLTERTRPLGVTRARETVRQFTSGRETMRTAREYAEQWYQAIREPQISEVELGHYAAGNPHSGGMLVLGIGAYSGRRGGAYGAGNVAHYLKTPGPRSYTEGEVGRQVTTMSRSASHDLAELGSLLERLRCSGGLTSLVDERGGWASPRDRAMLYARAVLTLAVRLGDVLAQTHLGVLQKSGV